jgi:hypothetical protein
MIADQAILRNRKFASSAAFKNTMPNPLATFAQSMGQGEIARPECLTPTGVMHHSYVCQ